MSGVIRLTNKRYAAVTVFNQSGERILETEGANRVVFWFRKSVDERANEGNIRIYNLADDEIGAVNAHAFRVLLDAGTDDRHGCILSGDVVHCFSAHENQQSYVSLSVVDGDGFYSSYVRISLGAQAWLGSLVEKAVAECSSPIGVGYITRAAYQTSLVRGVAILGSPVDVIRNVAKTLNATFYVDNSLLYLFCANDRISEPVTIGNEDGILGIPSRDNWYAFFRNDIDAGISIGQFVTFAKEYGGGTFRVVEIDGSGDTKDGDWALNVTALAQAGENPNVTSVTKNIWR